MFITQLYLLLIDIELFILQEDAIFQKCYFFFKDINVVMENNK